VGKIAHALRLHTEFERAGFAPAARPHATSGDNTRRARPRNRRPRSRA
jgi:hypothetical protein